MRGKDRRKNLLTKWRTMTKKITGIFTTKAPLSHISESIGTTSYLVQEPILQSDGRLEEVFCYSGNAWRGQLRDLAAIYMLDLLEIKITLDSFHLLFSGGKIGGDQVVNVEKIKNLRQSLPMLALFGGGVGNTIMPGLMRVGNCYPICKEALPVLPSEYKNKDGLISYTDVTFEKEFSRVDDSKKSDLLKEYTVVTPIKTEQSKKKIVSDQMRMSSELICAGIYLYTYIDVIDDNAIYLGVLLSAISQLAGSPFIGGQNNKGHGLVDIQYKLNGYHFIQIVDGKLSCSKDAEHLLEEYNQYLLNYKESILKILV